ncbi:calcineurin-like phosphoesterase C-terminal domain-containing protein [Sphingobacterium phlebotomi]|nr:calcineurin-like phosphoesterase family protein [Sphingobacterium phlebotomi]
MKPKNKNYNRRDFIWVSAVTGIGLSLNLYSCTKEAKPIIDHEQDEDDITGIRLADVSIDPYIDIEKGGSLDIEGKGFDKNDQIIFRSLNGIGEEYTLNIQSLMETYIQIVLPAAFLSGKYRVTIKRGQHTAIVGDTSLDIVFNRNIPDREGTNLKGVVYSGGVGVANVVVSDGYNVVKTDENGVYYLWSPKENGYIFVSIPGNYEVNNDGSLPLFFNKLTRPMRVTETKDFELTPVNNDKHIVLALGDMHLANRQENGDIAQFQEMALKDINETIQAYQSSGTKVYALTLGDQTWETFWRSNNYGLPEYRAQMDAINAPVFNTIGNHDHNPYVDGDWATADKYREILGPNYYSFNIGRVHYVVLDNVEYANSGATPNSMGNRHVNETIVADQMNWLRKDLAMIEDKSTPIVIAMHIPLHQRPSLSGGQENPPKYALTNAEDFVAAVSGFSKVHVITGHIHTNYTVENSSNLMEHNTGAVCATWWWTGAVGYAGNHVCKDGSPGGYGVWEMDNKDVAWYYKGIGYNRNYQFRAYDLNEVHITQEEYAPDYRGDEWNTYSKFVDKRSDNVVLVNVWSYDSKWKVEMIENGVPLPVTRVNAYDPLHNASYNARRLNANETPATSFVSTPTTHMFRAVASGPTTTVEIRVTDRFGNVYTETMVRPKAFGYLMH